MGDASRVMPGISQRDSLSTALPIENSPPGIHTIPGGAGTGAEFVLGIVGSNVDEALDAAVVADIASRLGAIRAWTVNAATVTRLNISNARFPFMIPSNFTLLAQINNE